MLAGAALLAASIAALVLPVVPAAAAGRIRPPVMPQDRPDPELVHDGSRWFAYSTNLFWEGHNVPVMRSTTLDTWTNVGDALPNVGDWASEGFTWAPGVVKLGSTWVMYYTAMHTQSQRQCIGRAVSTSAAGPFVDDSSAPLVCQLDRGGSIDADPYVDRDGSAWLVWKSDDNALGAPTTLWMQSLSADGLSLLGSPAALLTASESWQQGIIENPSLAYVNGTLWLFYSGGWWDSPDYATGYATCSGRMVSCSNQSRGSPWMSHSSTGVPGVGGGTVLTRAGAVPVLAFHGWHGAASYNSGGVRAAFIEPLDFSSGAPTWRPDLPRNLAASSLPSPRIAGDSPIGWIDQVIRVPGGLNVAGWALDPDLTDPIDVHAYVGRAGAATRAALRRDDIAAAFPSYGTQHGYAVDVPATEGTYDVCAYGINVAVGSNSLLGCRRVGVSSTPFGWVDATGHVPGGIGFFGWALDPDTGAPIDVHVYAGRSGVATTAGVARSDIAAAFPGYGSEHGFGAVVQPATGGPQDLCAYAINVGAGSLGVLSCATADVRVDPWGAVDLVQRVPGGVRVAGWAIDPSTATSLDVHVYVADVGYSFQATQPRNDLLGPFPQWGPAHGYDQVLPVPGHPVEVCAFAIDQGPGENVLVDCRRV